MIEQIIIINLEISAYAAGGNLYFFTEKRNPVELTHIDSLKTDENILMLSRVD